MAKLLDSITIDGTEMKVYENYFINSGVQTVNLPANVSTEGASIQINKPGLYAIASVMRFTDGSVTGGGLIMMNVKRNGESFILLSQRVPNQYGIYMQLERILALDDAAIPTTISLEGLSGMARNNCTFQLVATRLFEGG